MDSSRDDNPVSFKSVLRSIRDGSASVPMRLVVSLLAGIFLTAVTSVGCFVVAAIFPPPYMNPAFSYPSNMVRVTDDTAIVCFLVAGVVYVILLLWIWSRSTRRWPLWGGVGRTLGVWLIALLVCALLADMFVGDEEFLIFGVVFAAIGLTAVVWLRVYQRASRGRPLYEKDGLVDVRCPKCQYRMVGLTEARCPECGEAYTLDQLVGQQDFDVLRRSRSSSAQAPPPPIPATEQAARS